LQTLHALLERRLPKLQRPPRMLLSMYAVLHLIPLDGASPETLMLQ
jgi:hypothetical protein